MPSKQPLPTVADFRAAFAQGIRAEEKLVGDQRGHWSTRGGGGLDVFGGTAAVLWQRQGQHTQRLFRACTLASASGEALDVRGLAEFGEAPIAASYGSGAAILSRSTGAGGAGTIYAGSRIEILGPAGLIGVYRVSEDTPVDASVLSVSVPVEATRKGSGTGAQASSGLRWGEDTIFDETLLPTVLACADGTDRESPEAYVARVTRDRLARRPGYDPAITAACFEAGAIHVVIIGANAFGDDADFGVTHLYVSDASYETSDELKQACALALDDVAVAGADAQVLGMTKTAVSLAISVTIAGSLADINPVTYKASILATVLAEFAQRKEFWLFRTATLEGATLRTDPSRIREVDVTSTPSEPAGAFVDMLPRYTLAGTDVNITLLAEP